ncbi:metal-dependent transcriptional regulator [Erysipelothrix aquatica]|uniref:metal-dependent transcriptional regulator n=1 Tax=Erysipelothrix aquatica TaxID=2683714 RepID=UPI00135C64C9|nr:metal-dependent transcriptional regulator [Erysipelothrix aquatica]
MTPNREDYIKIIFAMNQRNIKLTNKELAATLDVSAASTSEMIRKLTESGLVVRHKDLGLTLSKEGTREAQNLVRKHRLWEVFLVEQLGYSWTDVHDDAEVLEHVTSNNLAQKLSEYLNNPKYCPHGSIIYGNGGLDRDGVTPLASLKVGDSGTFSRVRDDLELLKYLETISFNLGETFELVRIDPYEGPFVVNVNGKEVAISYRAAHDIEVEVTQ